jgi:hypothetical protein
MFDKTPNTPEKKVEPNAQEAYFFFNIIKNVKGKLDVDWDKVALDTGFKSAEVARVS